MTCGPNRTCYAGCSCNEERWRAELAAAEARCAELEAALREIAEQPCLLVRDGLFRSPGDCAAINARHPAGSCGACIARRALEVQP